MLPPGIVHDNYPLISIPLVKNLLHPGTMCSHNDGIRKNDAGHTCNCMLHFAFVDC